MVTIPVWSNTTISPENLGKHLATCDPEQTAAVFYAMFLEMEKRDYGRPGFDQLGKACAHTNPQTVGKMSEWLHKLGAAVHVHAEIDRRKLEAVIGGEQ
jgi:hypothetical protein